MDANIVKLPVMETVRRSFMYVIKNFRAFLQIISIFSLIVVYELATGFPSLCSVSDSYCQYSGFSTLSTVLFYLASIILAVSLTRNIILKQEYKWFHLYVGKRDVIYMLYNLLIAVMIIIPTILMTIIAQTNKVSSQWLAITMNVIIVLTPLILSMICLKLYLVFPATAIDDKDMTLAKSFAVTKGNIFRIFIGQCLLFVPTLVLLSALYYSYRAADWGFIGNMFFVAFALFVSLLYTAFKSSYYSHMYQYFLYFNKK